MVKALPISVQIAYDLATSIGAKRVVQVGAWPELSVALARAIDGVTGGRGGLLVTTDLDASSVIRTRTDLVTAGLDDYAQLCAGDPRIALQHWEGPFDFVWLGCNAEVAADVLAILEGRLRDGAVVTGIAAPAAPAITRPRMVPLQAVAALR